MHVHMRCEPDIFPTVFLFIGMSAFTYQAALYVFCTDSKQQGARLLCQQGGAVIFQSTGRYYIQFMHVRCHARWRCFQLSARNSYFDQLCVCQLGSPKGANWDEGNLCIIGPQPCKENGKVCQHGTCAPSGDVCNPGQYVHWSSE